MKKILVVDDDPSQIFTIDKVIKAANKNYKIISAESGQRCLHLLETKKPDLILLDIMMPGMDGWETYKHIKNNDTWKDIPIIFITAREDDMAKKTGSFLGSDFINKPFDKQDFLKRIDMALNRN